MILCFTATGGNDSQHWFASDRSVPKCLNAVLENTTRTRFDRLWKPERLKGHLTGWWLRRITVQHRLVYRVPGQPDVNQRVDILQGRYHYTV